jgi:hypothetical protein
MKAFARSIVEARWFEPFMIGLILFNAVLIGLETSKDFNARYEDLLHAGNHIILGVFIWRPRSRSRRSLPLPPVLRQRLESFRLQHRGAVAHSRHRGVRAGGAAGAHIAGAAARVGRAANCG